MVPITLIVTALVAGAALGMKDTAPYSSVRSCPDGRRKEATGRCTEPIGEMRRSGGDGEPCVALLIPSDGRRSIELAVNAALTRRIG